MEIEVPEVQSLSLSEPLRKCIYYKKLTKLKCLFAWGSASYNYYEVNEVNGKLIKVHVLGMRAEDLYEIYYNACLSDEEKLYLELQED